MFGRVFPCASGGVCPDGSTTAITSGVGVSVSCINAAATSAFRSRQDAESAYEDSHEANHRQDFHRQKDSVHHPTSPRNRNLGLVRGFLERFHHRSRLRQEIRRYIYYTTCPLKVLQPLAPRAAPLLDQQTA